MSRERARPIGAAAASALAVLLLLLLTPAIPARAAATVWQHELLAPVRPAQASAVTYRDHPHLWSIDQGDLRHDWWDGTRWRSETLDGAGGGSGRTLAPLTGVVTQLYRDRPHVWYVDTDRWDLRHAWWNGTRWRFETLDGDRAPVGAGSGRTGDAVGTELAVTTYRDRPHVYYRTTRVGGPTVLRQAYWTGREWWYRELRQEDEPVRGLTAVTYGGPHIWTAVGDGLRHSWWGGGRWQHELLPAAAPAPGPRSVEDPVAALGPDGRPHVLYEVDGAGIDEAEVRDGWWDGTRWSFRALRTGSHCPCVALRRDPALHAWFQGSHETNSGEITMHHGQEAGAGWTIQQFGGPTSPWGAPLAATTTSTRLHVWYASEVRTELWHASS